MRKLSVVLIMAGILTALYPVAERAVRVQRQEALLDNLVMALETGRPVAGEEEEVPGEVEAGENGGKVADPALLAAAGVLYIDKIGLKVPLLRGLNDKNLKVGAVILDGSAEIGEEGNTAVAAHRTHVYGRLFNRLNELQPGDSLVVVTFDGEYRYEVYENRVVKKEDVSVLEAVAGERTLTLITCHPLNRVNPPYRLVVRAKLGQGEKTRQQIR